MGCKDIGIRKSEFVTKTFEKRSDIFSGQFFSNLRSVKLPWVHLSCHNKFGPDVYLIQADRQTNKHTSQIYINRLGIALIISICLAEFLVNGQFL